MREKKNILALAALVLAAALMLGLWRVTRPQTQAGEKTVTVEVVHGDGRRAEFTYVTGQEYLGVLLLEEGLISGEEGPFGLYITAVDGETAQDSLNQWWCVTKGGERVDTGADLTPIADGDRFELTLSVY